MDPFPHIPTSFHRDYNGAIDEVCLVLGVDFMQQNELYGSFLFYTKKLKNFDVFT